MAWLEPDSGVRGGAPHPGSVYGRYPERREADGHRPTAGRIAAGGRRWWPAWPGPALPAAYARVASQARALAGQWRDHPAELLVDQARIAAARVACEGFTGQAVTPLLACVAVHAHRTLDVVFQPAQYLAACALLDQRLAEMATGEGKTLAAALAASCAALVGIPVHLMTANDYLARRDADGLAPLYRSLGLSSAAALEDDPPARRAAAYRAAIVHATARVITFDHLRDRLRQDSLSAAAVGEAGGGEPMLRGLCMAIVDEADSVLIDEARLPLVLADNATDGDERARVWQSLDLAGRLLPGRHFETFDVERRVVLGAAGRRTIEALASEYGGGWLNRQHREELVCTALTALHLLRRDVDYLVRDGGVHIIDSNTGRRAEGRVWSRGLHAAVALKERVTPPPATRTRISTTYPQLFARYHHLCGLSGSLLEARAELRAAYGLATVLIPPQHPRRRVDGPTRVFADRQALFDAACHRAGELAASGRAVLLAADSVADSTLLAQALRRAGVPHVLLNAGSAVQEAQVIADAGRIARITVSTQMAGRGTDIALSEAVRRTGGLHVLNLQHNRSRRIDRQIAGRAGRQGAPGSTEHWVRADATLFADGGWAGWLLRTLVGARLVIPSPLARRLVGATQRSVEARDARERRSSRRHDRRWSRRLFFAPGTE